MSVTRLTLRCSWREDELIDRMKLDSDHEKQVLPAARLPPFAANFSFDRGTRSTLAMSGILLSCSLCQCTPAQVDAALSRAEAVRACTEIGKMLYVAVAVAVLLL
jgi:hypothetical protein